MPTELNLYTLNSSFQGAVSIPNGRFQATQMAGVRRCLKFGLITVEGGRGGSVTLTELGQHAMCGYAFDNGARGWDVFTKNSF